jgi:hypothetical protein
MFAAKSPGRSSQYGIFVLSLFSSNVGIEDKVSKQLKRFDYLIPVFIETIS